MMTDALRMAHRYAKAGLRVVPIKPGAKHPWVTGWQDAATDDVATIDGWFAEVPDSGVGLVLGPQPNRMNLFVVDVDGREGFDQWRALLNEHGMGSWPATWTAETGSGGLHVWWRAPDEVSVRNQQSGGNRLGAKIDVRGLGGQVVSPPSPHPETGAPYVWMMGPFDMEPMVAPDWLLGMVTGRPTEPPPPPVSVSSMPVADDADAILRWRPTWSWHSELEAAGWRRCGAQREGSLWVRPGKEARDGHSAVLHEPDGPFVVFTTAMNPLWQKAGSLTQDGSGWAFGDFGMFAALHHGGDRTAAFLALKAQYDPDPPLSSLLPPSSLVVAGSVPPPPPGAPPGRGMFQLVNWAELSAPSADIVDQLLYPGRWTALAAPAKAGKSQFLLYVSTMLAQGTDPLWGYQRDPVKVLWIDAEMGPMDLAERLERYGFPDPSAMTHWHAMDVFPRLDDVVAGAGLCEFVAAGGYQVVVIDGINGTVAGEENSDVTWRAFYDFTIGPLKKLGVAVLTADNLGKDASKGARGSSVKVDKADAVIALTRNERGIKLKATHRRTAAFLDEMLVVVDVDDEDEPNLYQPQEEGYPARTKECVAVLDRLGVDHKLSKNAVTAILRQERDRAVELGEDPSDFQWKGTVILAANRFRKKRAAGRPLVPIVSSGESLL